MKELTIIVPIYNGEKYVRKCIDSLLKVKCDKEIIVINDCSNDNSLSILQEYSNRINLIDLKENHGVSYTRNLGIKKAKGKYIGFVDVDDLISDDMFDKMIEKIKENNSEVCVCNYDEMIEKSGNVTCSKYNYENKTLKKDKVLSNYLLDKISPAIWDKIYKKELLNNIRFDENLTIGEDILFCLNIFMKAKNVTFINEYLYHYLQQDNSVMHSVSSRLLQFRDVINYININDRKMLEEKFNEEFNFFKLEMITRGIHSISSLNNNRNKRLVKRFLSEYYNKDELNSILKCEYFSKSIKLEIFILKIFGIRFHLLMMPVYKFIRNKVR